MKAIHLKTVALASKWSRAAIETALARVKGVAGVAVVSSVGLVSVLFDETKANAEQIVRAIRSAGFDVRVCQPGV